MCNARSSGSISTGVGDANSLGGHAIAPITDNTTLAAYGGNLFGNLWRFDINGDIGAAGYDAQLLPITVTLLEATVNGKPVVFAGTRALPRHDLSFQGDGPDWRSMDDKQGSYQGFLRFRLLPPCQQTPTPAPA